MAMGIYALLTKNGKGLKRLVHVMLANEFIDNPSKERCVGHIDGKRKNNSIDNLCWANLTENQGNRKKGPNTYL